MVSGCVVGKDRKGKGNMKKRILLTSFVTLGIVGAAHAETFPTDGVMQENKTYENAATYTNMGVYSGSVMANAEYEDILYQIAAGQYLPARSETPATCTAGNYCVGLTDAKYNETTAQGLSACPSSYPNSDIGARSETQCYTACTLAGANIAHATVVEGNDYYGTGTDTCSATACDNGYHVDNSIRIVEQAPLIPVDYNEFGSDYAYIGADGGNPSGNSDWSTSAGITEPNTWASKFDYGVVYGRASCQQPTPNGQALMYVATNLGALMGGEMSEDDFISGLSAYVGESKAKSAFGLMKEKTGSNEVTEAELNAALWAVFGVENNAEFSTGDTGSYCYCQMTDYMASGGAKQSVAAAPWVFANGSVSAGYCAGNCAHNCAYNLQYDGTYYAVIRAAVFGSLGALDGGVCAANEIEIEWRDADPADVTANNAGVCTYDSDIRTPVKAVTKPGKTFKGWRFDKK